MTRGMKKSSMRTAHAVVLFTLVSLVGCASDQDEQGEQGEQGEQSQAVESIDAGSDSTADVFPSELLPDELVEDLQLIVPPNGGQTFFSDIIMLEPGQDITLCTFVDGTTEDVTYIHDTQGVQSHYGHHAVLMYAPQPEAPGTRDCGDMERFRQILGGTGGQGEHKDVLPGNIVSEVPAGVQFVVNHHWIHYGEEPAEVQAMLATIPPDSQDDLVIARALTNAYLGFSLPPAQATTFTGECVIERDVPVLVMLGHEHEWGTNVKAERVSPDGSVELLFDHAYTPEMTSNATLFRFPADEPLMLHAGDTVRMTCDWVNDTDEAIGYPREMCVFFAYTMGDSDMTCVGGNWLGGE